MNDISNIYGPMAIYGVVSMAFAEQKNYKKLTPGRYELSEHNLLKTKLFYLKTSIYIFRSYPSMMGLH